MENHISSIALVPKSKKGMGIGDIYPVILTIILVAILIAISIFILDQFGETWKDNEGETVINETLGAVMANANQTVAYSTRCEFNDMVVTAVTNSSTGAVIPVANYTAYGNGNIVNATTMIESGSGLWNVSYTYSWGGKPCEATVDIAQDFTDFIPWIGIILLIIAAAIVLGILVRSFSGGGRV